MNDTTTNLARLVIPDTSTIREAMQAIDSNGREVVLVQDDTGRIAGLISDGDIRRGLLAGLAMESLAAKIMTRDFFTCSPNDDRASVLDLMKARMFQHVPVLDKNQRLVGVHFLQDLIGATRKPNIAVVMAGGKGTRLRSAAGDVPKPMAEIAGRPMLERLVLHLVGHGFTNIYLAVNFKAEVIEKHFGDGTSFGCQIHYLKESKPLGTGGALSLLPKEMKHPFLVLNGDLITRADLTAMLEAHLLSGCVATVGSGPYQVQIPYGTIKESEGRLVSLDEKPAVGFLVNRGIYILDPSTIPFVPKDQEFPITDLFDRLLEAKKRVGVFNFDDAWIDVGAPEDLQRARGLA